MPQFIVLDDTRRHPELAERITEILRTVAPMVEEATGLPVPPTVRYRLMTPTAWRHELREQRRRSLVRDIADLDLPSEHVKAAHLSLKITSFIPVLVWPLVLGATGEAADGQSETFIAPRALRHTGLLAHEPSLNQMVIHELTHQLQAEARSDDAAWHTVLPHLRNVDTKGVSAFVEGHAHWTDQHVTTQMYGHPVDHHRQAPRSLRYRMHNSFPGVRRLGPSRSSYEQGALLIRRAVASQGVDLVNRVWKDVSLLPTREEIAAPETWIRRIAV
ncbi:zinc-dependent metalloprotease [Streptomyces bottropensis]|uniref:zinc-dependent metalloprotease n=1 Tax=Streptomyces bottropensis TaxID=42235 RepID=UPI00367C7D26